MSEERKRGTFWLALLPRNPLWIACLFAMALTLMVASAWAPARLGTEAREHTSGFMNRELPEGSPLSQLWFLSRDVFVSRVMCYDEDYLGDGSAFDEGLDSKAFPSWLASDHFESMSIKQTKRGGHIFVTSVFGWPFRALAYDHWQAPGRVESSRFAWPTTPFGAPIDNAIPLRPYWPGALANTAFYLFILTVLHAITRATLLVLRRRQDRCPRCRYSLTGLTTPVCPECGAEITPQTRSPSRGPSASTTHLS